MQLLAGACSSQAVGLRVLVARSCPLKATLWSLSHGAVFRTSHNMASVCIKERWKKSQRVLARQKSQSYNLVSKVRCHHFCCVVFVGCESLVPAHIRGRGWHRWEPGVTDSWDHLPRLLNTAGFRCFILKLRTGSSTPASSILPGSCSVCSWICKAGRRKRRVDSWWHEYFSPRKTLPFSTTCRIPGDLSIGKEMEGGDFRAASHRYVRYYSL